MFSDLKYALRLMAKSPVFSFVAIATLAIGIGANTAVFSVVEGTLLRPLPFPHPEQLVRLYEADDETAGSGTWNLSEQTVRQWREYGGKIFQDIAAASGTSLNIGYAGNEAPVSVQGARVTGNFFSVLGLQPVMGRSFTEDEDRENGPDVAIISNDFWRAHLNGRADVVGSTIRVDGKPHTVIGVMPKTFRHPYRAEVWVPARLQMVRTSGPVVHYLYAPARLQPGISRAQAESAVRQMCRRVNEAEPNPNNAHGAYMPSLRESFVIDLRPKILVIVGAALCALLIAAANFAGLLLARVIEREGECALRSVLGANRGQLIRQHLVQALVLAAIGTLVGLVIAWSITPALFSLSPEGSDANGSAMRDFDYDTRVDWPVFSFAAGVMLLIGVGFGLLPAIRAARTDLREAIKATGRGTTLDRNARRLLGSLVVVELAVAVALLMASITATQYFRKLINEPWGFATDNRIIFSETPSDQLFPTGEAKREVIDAILVQLRALPGVLSATVTSPSPMNPPRDLIGFNVIDAPPAPEPRGYYPSYVRAAPPEYFKTVEQPLLRGREFLETDKAGAPFVCMVSESFARRFWPNEDPIGKQLKWGRIDGPRPRLTVVGVIADMKAIADPRDGEVIGMVARPLAQMAELGSVLLDDITFVIHSDHNSVNEAAIRAAVARADSRLAPFNIVSLDQAASQSRATERFISVLVSLFGFLGLILSAVGLYGLLSLQVARRYREFGIRSALGATVRQLIELVVRQGASLLLIGVAAGGVATWAVVRLVRTQWPQMPTPNVIAWIGGIVVLSAAVAVACWLPARRAARIDPVIALRSE
jgi:putative ABC transport system permease protein